MRWLGSLLGAGLPVLVLVGYEAARRGIAPAGGRLVGAGLQDVVAAIPATAASLLWPLLALVIGVQSFSARSSGAAESAGSFEVARRLWVSRLAASAGSLLIVMSVTLAVWAGLVVLGGSSKIWIAGNEGTIMGMPVLLGGFAFAGTFLLAATAAAALVGNPFVASLLGLALAILPFVLASISSFVFPYAVRWDYPVGAIAVWLLPVGYAAASFTAFPSARTDRGSRIVRGALSVAFALIASCFLFGMLARARPQLLSRDVPHLRIDPSPAGGLAALLRKGDSSIWLVDVDRAQVVASLPPPNTGLAWRADGSMLALATSSGPMGSLARARVGFFGRDGKTAARSWIAPDPRSILHGLWWCGRRLVIRNRQAGADRLDIVEPETGASVVAEIAPSGQRWEVAGPAADGGLIVAVEKLPATTTGSRNTSLELHRLDPVTGILDARPLSEEDGSLLSWDLRHIRGSIVPMGVSWRLSPSGRYWLLAPAPPTARGTVVDLVSGSSLGTGGGAWLAEDSLARIEREGAERTLVLETLGQTPRVVGSWRGEVSFAVSPDRRRLLVRVGTPEGPRLSPPFAIGPQSAGMQESVYEPAADRWIQLPDSIDQEDGNAQVGSHGVSSPSLARVRRLWAGPRTLARMTASRLELEDIDSPGTLRTVIGEPLSR